jgi:hypothetical protein
MDNIEHKNITLEDAKREKESREKGDKMKDDADDAFFMRKNI